jgi:hypothetical protein
VKSFLWLTVAYLLIEIALGFILQHWPSYPVWTVGWTLLFALYFVLLRLLKNDEGENLLPWMLAAAILIRIPLLAWQPLLSDDIYRYVWDGLVFTNGINPFEYAPSDPALAHLATDWHHLINYPEIPTIYPPLTQAIWALTASISPTVLAFKILSVIGDLACVLMLAAILQAKGLSRSLAAIYALCPLSVIESSYSGHLEPIPIFFLLLAVYLFERGREKIGIIAIAGSILAKFFPIALLPILYRHITVKKQLLVVPVVFVGAYVLFASAGKTLFHAFGTYGGTWYFNASVFVVLERLLGDPLFARIAAGLLFLCVVALCTWRKVAFDLSAFIIAGTWLILTTTFHPWYALWVLPWMAIYRSRAFMWLIFALGFSYYALFQSLAGGVWVESPTVRLVTSLTFFALLVVDLIAARPYLRRNQ